MQLILPCHSIHQTKGNDKTLIWYALIVLFGKYRQTSNIKHTLVDNKIVDYSDVVGASPVGAAPTTSSSPT